MTPLSETPVNRRSDLSTLPPGGARTAPTLSDSQILLGEVMIHLAQVFWIRDAGSAVILFVSPSYEQLWGHPVTSLYDGSHTFRDSVHLDDRHRILNVMDREEGTHGYDVHYRISRPDGSTRWIWARTYPVRDTAGNIRRYAGIAEDVSEDKWAEKERARLVAIIERADDSVMSVTMEGLIIDWNNGAEKKYGYTAQEIVGSSIYKLIPAGSSEAYDEMVRKAVRGEHVAAYDTLRTRKDGTQFNLSVTMAPIEGHDGTIIGVSKIGHELGQVRKLEAQLIESQKMEVVGQLTGGVAHDFNNILAVTLGYSELMLGEEALDEIMRKRLDSIRLAALRGAGLVRQLLIFSRKEAVEPVILDLNTVVLDLEEMLRPLLNESIEIISSPGENLGRIKADPGYIEQVLMNLVVNARDAMPSGGKVFISTSNVSLDEKRGDGRRDTVAGEHVMLSVRDTGCGMSNETTAKAFEPFFTTKPPGQGTGLGLSTCRTIVHQSGGHIELYSELGRGTTFKIYFPRVTQHLPGSTPSLFRAKAMPSGTETLLVVEDDPALRRLVADVLETLGYRVLIAANGADGIQVASENRGEVIRLVITDVVMPHMSGREMADRLLIADPGLRILFTSGYQTEGIRYPAPLGQKIGILAKPYSIAILTHHIRLLLDA